MPVDTFASTVRDEIAFSTTFPLPYRVLALGAVGILGWSTNLHGLNLLGIDAATALELSTLQPKPKGVRCSSPPHSSSLFSGPDTPDLSSTPLPTHNGWKLVPHPSSIYRPVYRLFLQYSLLVLASWGLYYRHSGGGKLELVDLFKFIPAVTMISLAMFLVCPFVMFENRVSDKFL